MRKRKSFIKNSSHYSTYSVHCFRPSPLFVVATLRNNYFMNGEKIRGVTNNSNKITPAAGIELHCCSLH